MENENGSDEYNQFVLSLGWEVRLIINNVINILMITDY